MSAILMHFISNLIAIFRMFQITNSNICIIYILKTKWVEFLRAIDEEKLSSLNETQKTVFAALIKINNIPRNEIKFTNFLKVTKKTDESDAKAIWAVIEAQKSDLNVSFNESPYNKSKKVKKAKKVSSLKSTLVKQIV